MIPAGVLCAGDGARFASAGETRPKPLVEVAGRPLIGWILDAFRRAGLSGPTILFNTRNAVARAYVEDAFRDLRPRFVVRDTASTLESFCVLSRTLDAPAYLLATADAVFEPGRLGTFLGRASRRVADLSLGVTRRADDTSLRVVAERGWARTIEKGGQGPAATAGVYLCTARAREEAEKSLAGGCPSLSKFLGRCPGLGLRVAAVDMGTVFDVDRPEEAEAAAERLRPRRSGAGSR